MRASMQIRRIDRSSGKLYADPATERPDVAPEDSRVCRHRSAAKALTATPLGSILPVRVHPDHSRSPRVNSRAKALGGRVPDTWAPRRRARTARARELSTWRPKATVIDVTPKDLRSRSRARRVLARGPCNVRMQSRITWGRVSAQRGTVPSGRLACAARIG